MQARQGDILLEKIDALPKGVKKKDNTLAYGETTGHSHRAEGKNVCTYVDDKGIQYVEVKGQAAYLHHEEHKLGDGKGNTDAPLAPGIYQVTPQREFDLVEGIRRVSD